MGTMRYEVYFTPLLNADMNTYDTEIDVTERIRSAGVGTIKRSIDSADYDVGVFAFSDLELTASNVNGYFNENDYRSIFTTIRDRCKVRVVFKEIETVRNSEGTVLSEVETAVVTYRGLINDEATRLDITNDTIRLKILSRDSALRTTKVAAGVISNGMLFSDAIFTILNVPKINSVLTIDISNITPDLDLAIDDGSKFSNKGVKESLDLLLFASNSCMLIDDAGVVTIRSRLADSTTDVVTLYGKNDLHYRENVIDITNYNNGKQRMFTSFIVNNFEISNSAFVQSFGFRQKNVTLDFITTGATSQAIATRAVREWKTPKVEVNVKVATRIIRSAQLLDRVTLSAPLRVKPPPGTFLPIVGVTKIGEADQPLPFIFGSLAIAGNIRFKIIEIEDNVESFTSILKLRQDGNEIDDGYFNEPGSCLVGFSKVGEAIICDGGDPCDAYNPAYIGSAQIGCTRVA